VLSAQGRISPGELETESYQQPAKIHTGFPVGISLLGGIFYFLVKIPLSSDWLKEAAGFPEKNVNI